MLHYCPDCKRHFPEPPTDSSCPACGGELLAYEKPEDVGLSGPGPTETVGKKTKKK